MGNLIDIIGYAVSALTIVSFLFQFHKTITHNDSSGISYTSQLVLSVGVVMWMFYAGGTKTIAPGIVNSVIVIPVLITLYNSLKDNGVSIKTSIGIPIIIGISWFGSFIFFILSMGGVISGDFISIFGLIGIFVGGTCTAMAFIPQSLKTLKTKNVKSLSFGMTFTYSVSQLLWILLFVFITISAVSPSGIDTATNIWSIVTAVIPAIVQLSLLFAILKWRQYRKIR